MRVLKQLYIWFFTKVWDRRDNQLSVRLVEAGKIQSFHSKYIRGLVEYIYNNRSIRCVYCGLERRYNNEEDYA